jgi:hypothetical protein
MQRDHDRPTADVTFDVGAVLASLQRQLEQTRQQLLEVIARPDPKDLTVQQVVDAYLAEWPDPICLRAKKSGGAFCAALPRSAAASGSARPAPWT